MAGRGALNDNDVQQEMNKMVAFIKQEALEKAREIKVKADEEFNIEKAKLVRTESANIEATFQRKSKQVEVQKKIAQSNFMNKARLRVLQQRQQMLQELFAEASKSLASVIQDAQKYDGLMYNIILQGLYKLMAEDVVLVCRKKDAEVAQRQMEAAKKTFTEKMALPLNIRVSSTESLPEEGSGGIRLSTVDGSITCDNTLEARLVLLCEQMLPAIRTMLFGESPNRKFFN
ncbi:MAG: ATPase, V1/A1 complex, subunit E [Olpidium bornovanus]|uniref:ATPase, V1/A1 complex, subunit E n=1 Tax=Olpidium bornovanus TaxID=278681 RepID=A0A8H8DL02_9FUNG|nr:MAG: ATPase, V1/A1 complex, subunit E [Olpidium bornovanus]